MQFTIINKENNTLIGNCDFKEFGRRHQVLTLKNKVYDDIYMKILKSDYYKEAFYYLINSKMFLFIEKIS